jgi:uncharacterized protein YndB with AHSA1/START domain
MATTKSPVAKAGMLIRRPVADVFEAFVDPAITARFWFSRGSGRLEGGARVRWDWEMYGVGSDVLVKAIEPGRRILIDWDLENPTEVEWTFAARGEGRTWVEVENRGFDGTPEERVEKALDSTGGFALVLAGAKIWLEHGIEPGFVLDRHPDARVEGWKDR